MPKSLPLALLLFPLCLSCNRYQYSTISSRELDKNDQNEFVYENDDLIIVYNFMGRDLGVNIFIVNKLLFPIFIDWQHSGLIANGHTNSYAPVAVGPNGKILGESGASAIEFIPPHDTYNKTPLVLNLSYLTTIPEAQLHKTRYLAAGVSRTIKTARFTEATSPLKFSSHFVYRVISPEFEPRTFEHNFYISDVMNTLASPSAIMLNGNHGNQCYTSKLTQGGVVGAVIGTGVIAAGVILAGKINRTSGPN